MKYLTRRYPNTNHQLWGDFESFFNTPSPMLSSYNSLFNWDSNAYRPAIDLFEDEENYFVQAELPGFDRKEITVELEKDRLVLKGARQIAEKGESSEVTFHRSVSLPDSVKSEKVAAKYDNGVLTVTIPKAEPTKPLQIEVKS
ncbi:MAG: Hsp20/alpha crystallin family protein [Verrucomicrobia bacterium]|nr:Hsp20/alpha crystallin family protein [Verrucomicrobiota bacterium]MDA1069409.1 Hsp20/alpha crystallin family protein [Verrucomicrobiota bacterium]